MKRILFSADSEISVFAVPDRVADHLEQYCLEFCSNWLHKSPDAEKYRVKTGDTIGVCYNEKDFIDYLNQYICDGPQHFFSRLACSRDGTMDNSPIKLRSSLCSSPAR